MKGAVLFDLDGTLWDSTAAIVPAWNRVLGKWGKTVTQADMAGIMGLTDREIAARFLPGLPEAEALGAIHAAAAAEAEDLCRTGARLYESVAETLEALAKEYRLFLVSNCMDGYIDAFLHAHGLGRCFTDAAWLGHPAEGKAENIRSLCRKYGLERACYVGDTASDGAAARAAGLPFIFAAYGFGVSPEHEGIIGEFRELPEALAALWETSKEGIIMRDYREETEKRVAFIRAKLAESHTSGIVYGNSGGKDSALTGILCKLACDDTVGICLPCESKRNFGEDMADGMAVAEKFHIETRVMDLTATKQTLTAALGEITSLNSAASTNINPRLRMTALYAVAAAENRLVAGTGNRSERYMGYFTKWGDGACDFNPIGDLNVTEIYEFLRYLEAPENIITKAPSAGLFDGQTDEQEMGVSYAAIDRFLDGGEVSEAERAVIERFHSRSEHKRKLPPVYGEE